MLNKQFFYSLSFLSNTVRAELDLEKDLCAACIAAVSKRTLVIEDAQMDERFAKHAAIRNTGRTSPDLDKTFLKLEIFSRCSILI